MEANNFMTTLPTHHIKHQICSSKVQWTIYLFTNFISGRDTIVELMETVDSTVPEPARALDSPFLMPIEQVHSIPGR